MTFRFVVDKIIKGRAYPALAQWQARPYTQAWREFGNHWPWTTPLRIEEYCRQHDYPIELYTIDDFPDKSWYPVCLGFFDFDCDYLSLLSAPAILAIRMGRLKILFMYHEGDNPVRMKQRLDSLCVMHQLDPECYAFVSSNTAAASLPRFVVFHDFELWYYQRNIDTAPLPIMPQRDRDFLCLSRMHKSWRAAVMADLESSNVLCNSLWSYCAVGTDNNNDDNPIEVDSITQLRYRVQRFLAAAPYLADGITDALRNDHSHMPYELFTRTYANIVLESQFDVDQSGGAFLTEKTFKPIKHAQMFFVVGAAGSLSALRNLDYRVFDHVLDNSYDAIEDHTQRWLALRDAISAARNQGLRKLYDSCVDDIEHNQKLFLQAPRLRLDKLQKQLDQLCL